MLLDYSNEFDVKKGRAHNEKLIAKKAKVELKEPRQVRTIRQNSYLHVCLDMFCKETGYDRDEVLEVFSHQLPELMRYDKNGINFRRSTKRMDTKELGILIDYIRKVSWEELSLFIPEAEDYLADKFRFDREIQQGTNY